MKRTHITGVVGRTTLLVAAVLLLGGGCLSRRAGRVKSLRVRISTAGLVQAGGKTVGFPKLVDLVRSLGATRATRIELELPRDAKADMVLQATRMLREAGYGKTIFISAERAEAYTVEEKAGPPPRRPARRVFR